MAEKSVISELPAIEPYPVGAIFKAIFSDLTMRVSIFSESRLKFEIEEGSEVREDIVNYDVRTIGDGIFLVSWQAKDKSTVTHVEDFNQKLIFSHTTYPDGTFKKREGKILEVRGIPELIAENKEEVNKALVNKVIYSLYQKRDATDLNLYFAERFIHHNPNVPQGLEALADAIAKLPTEFSYEPGMMVAQDDLVMTHGRMRGLGNRPQVAVNIFRISEGRIIEHWDVIQNEVPPESALSGMPMFESKEEIVKH